MHRRLDGLVTRGELFGARRVVHHFARRTQAVDVENQAFGAAVSRHGLDLGDSPVRYLQAHDQHRRRTAFLHDDVRACHSTMLIKDVLPEAAEAGHGVQEADLGERLFDGVFGDA